MDCIRTKLYWLQVLRDGTYVNTCSRRRSTTCRRDVKSNGEGVYAWLAGWQFVEVSPVFSYLVLVILSIYKWRGLRCSCYYISTVCQAYTWHLCYHMCSYIEVLCSKTWWFVFLAGGNCVVACDFSSTML